MKKKLQFTLAIISITLFGSISWGQVTTFNYTGSMQTYTVPAGVTGLHIESIGGAGYGTLGEGGSVEAVFTVTPGDVYQIFVGGGGGATTGGYNGGGVPGANATYGGGGGASDVRFGGVTLADRIIVAGGGGGSGSNCGVWTAEGGHGGGLIGQSGCDYSCSDCQYTGSGGTQVSGGIAGPTGHGSCGGNSNGFLGSGGSNLGAYGTGGGGGYYGGGSGCYEGAGGGSSYTHPDATEIIHTQGGNLGDGIIIVTELCVPIGTDASALELCAGEELTLTGTSTTGGTVSWDLGVVNGEAFVPPVGTTTYNVTSDSDGDCDVSIEIVVLPLPTVSASVDKDEICVGESVIFTAGGDAVSYEWFPVDIVDGEPYTPLGTGTFTVVGTADNDCQASADVNITVFEIVTITYVTTDEIYGSDGEIDITAIGGNPPYVYDWDMDGTGDFDDDEDLTGLTAGTYIVAVEGETGCTGTTTIVLASQVSIDELNQLQVEIFPNPTSKNLNIVFEGAFQYELSSVNGEKIVNGSAVNKAVLDLNNLAKGVYFITVKADDKTSVMKIIKD